VREMSVILPSVSLTIGCEVVDYSRLMLHLNLDFEESLVLLHLSTDDLSK
jgi:hypothetical protein